MRDTNRSRYRHLCIDLHLTLLKDLDLVGIALPLSLQVDLELRGSDTKHLHKSSLARVQGIAFTAHLVTLLAISQLKHNLALYQTGGNTELAQSRLNGVANGLILLGGDLAGTGVDETVRNGERSGGLSTGTGEIRGTKVLEVFNDRLSRAGGEQETDGAGEVGSELVQIRSSLSLGVVAQGLSHDLSLAEEETRYIMLVKYRRIGIYSPDNGAEEYRVAKKTPAS